MRVLFQTLGCRLNEAEVEAWARGFRALGHGLARDPEDADLVVINTCAVTQEALRKSRHLLRRAQRLSPMAKLVVTGCYATLREEEARSLGVDLVLDNRDKDRLPEIATRALDLHVMPSSALDPDACALLARGRQRAFIKIQDGCRHRCSFCIVTLARGEERSRPLAELVAEVDRLHGEGIGEVVLTGVHIGGYGSDRGTSLPELVHAILAETAVPRLRIGSVEPWDIDGRFWGLFDDPRLMPHLHLPLQSGSDAVLRRMARRCRTRELERVIAQARARIPDLNITTDLIVGFPGETDAEWCKTLSYVERLGFGQLHIFAFSPRPGTKAAGLPDPVPATVRRTRSAQLQTLGRQLKRAILERFVGRTLPVLVEAPQPGWEGYTPNFLRVRVQAPIGAALQGCVIPVRLEAVDESGQALLGHPAA